MIIAGVMSGSSLDGLDVAIVEFNDKDWSILNVVNLTYSERWESRLRNYHSLDAGSYVTLKYEYSHYIGTLLNDYFSQIANKPDYISFHGHTLIHSPEKGFTEQIGNGGIIAGRTNVSTLVDFRSQDVSLGGQGTPLAPFVEVNFIGDYNYYLNLGGIANITKVETNGISAYDVCPCNQVLNFFSLKKGLPYDEDGLLASQGRYIPELVNYIERFEYFGKEAPKSLDNNWIREVFIPNMPKASVEDTLHTYSRWMVDCIASQISSSVETKLYVSGGGAHNKFFIKDLDSALASKRCELVIPDKLMIDYKEAVLMSALAKNYLEDKPNVLCAVTGAVRDSIGGALYKV